MSNLTAERLRELLNYDPEIGVFTWRVSRGSKAGKTAGAISAIGYRVIRIDERLYYAHRLAWLYVHGRWPREHIDHANGVRSDNRFANLREATHSQNHGNSKLRSTNTSGVKGVYWCNTHHRWVATIVVRNRAIRLGTFKDKEAAGQAYRAAALKHFGEFARFN